jgi:pimeloyl-ACP methyl ester carboxylesterase
MAQPEWKEASARIAGVELKYMRGGAGSPLLVLHHDIGTLDRLAIYDELAKGSDVIVPFHPGFGKSERPDWMRHPRDIAVMYRSLAAQLGLGKHALLGLGFGGWIAAEMASMGPGDVSCLILVGAMGIKPPEGYILDQAIVSYIDYPQSFFHDRKAFESHFGNVTTDQLELWDICREMCFRIAWKPYMYSQTLPHLLKSVDVPSLVVWGEHDQVVPLSAGHAFVASLPNARLEIVKGSGHAVAMEKPDELAKLATGFLSAK